MKKNTKHILSKSTFISGLQCTKKLYLNQYFKTLKDATSPMQQAVFDRGHQIGELAQQLFPNGVDARASNIYDYAASVLKTKTLIQQGVHTLYEAAFQEDDVLAIVDILQYRNGVWEAYEVKSSTHTSETHLNDAALQYYVLKKAGISLQKVSILHLNSQYIRGEFLDLGKLFKSTEITPKVLEKQTFIAQHIQEFKTLLTEGLTPQVEIGPHCNTPYLCNFKGYCWQHIPSYSIFDISQLDSSKKWELYQQGIVQLQDIPNTFELNPKQWQQVQAALNPQTHLKKTEIKGFLDGVVFPLYFIDFETFGPAIPLFENTKPYEAIVFQFSLHILHTPNGELQHYEFLAEPNGKDPRAEFAQKLLEYLGEKGDIIVYNIAFERSKILSLSELFPSFTSKLTALAARMKDLMIPFQNRWYYTPEMKGSYSIKNVLPALVPHLSYKDLKIQEGGTASNVYEAMVTKTFRGNVEETKQDLLAYCQLDTLAMVHIYLELKKMV